MIFTHIGELSERESHSSVLTNESLKTE